MPNPIQDQRVPKPKEHTISNLDQKLEEEEKSAAKLSRNKKTPHQKLYYRRLPNSHAHIKGENGSILTVGEKIGEGTYSYVKAVQDTSSDNKSVLKVQSQFDATEKDFREEVRLLKQFSNYLKSIGILFNVDSFITEKSKQRSFSVRKYNIVMTDCGQELDNYLYENRSKLTSDQEFDIAIAFWQGISWLHQAGIAHRDIKPKNFGINLNENGQIICLPFDLGLSTNQLNNKPDKTVGTPLYVSDLAKTNKILDIFEGLRTTRFCDQFSCPFVPGGQYTKRQIDQDDQSDRTAHYILKNNTLQGRPVLKHIIEFAKGEKLTTTGLNKTPEADDVQVWLILEKNNVFENNIRKFNRIANQLLGNAELKARIIDLYNQDFSITKEEFKDQCNEILLENTTRSRNHSQSIFFDADPLASDILPEFLTVDDDLPINRTEAQEFEMIKKIYKALDAGTTTIFKRHEIDIDAIDYEAFKLHAETNAHSRSAVAQYLYIRYMQDRETFESKELIENIHQEAYENTGIFKNTNTKNPNNIFADMDNIREYVNAHPDSRTSKICHALEI